MLKIDPRNQMPVESQRRARGQTVRLSTQRTMSSIPKGDDDDDVQSTSSTAGCPAHSSDGSTTGPVPTSGVSASGQKWEYPSPQQFFNAVLRKGFTNTQAEDVPSMVSIHNAVNERAWWEILQWEGKYLPPESSSPSQQRPSTRRGDDADGGVESGEIYDKLARGECPGGIRLLSFKGDSSHRTPKARLFELLGYTKPFDTHFWTVDRCGKEIEYVIDFYKGKTASPDGVAPDGKLDMPSFYLDVRPAGIQGVPARLARAFGF